MPVEFFNVSRQKILENSTHFSKTNENTEEEFKVLRTVALVIIMVLSLVGNTSVCGVVLRDVELRSLVRKLALISLAAADLLMIQVILFRILYLLQVIEELSIHVCVVFAGMYSVLLYVSILHLFVLSIDKYVAVFYPLSYRQKVTVKRLVLVLVFIWLIPTIAVGVTLKTMENEVQFKLEATFMECIYFPANNASKRRQRNYLYLLPMYLNAVILFVIPLFCMLVAYFKIAKVSWYQSNRVGHELRGPEVRPRSARIRAREMKWAKTIGIMIGTFILCYLPIIMMLLYQTSNGLDPITSETILFLSFANTIINPLVYSLRSKEFRKALFKLCIKDSVVIVGCITSLKSRNRCSRGGSKETKHGPKRESKALGMKVGDTSELLTTSMPYPFVVTRALFESVLSEVLEEFDNHNVRC